MSKFRFIGVAFVSRCEVTVEAPTLADAIASVAQQGPASVDTECEGAEVEYSWVDLNSGVEVDE